MNASLGRLELCGLLAGPGLTSPSACGDIAAEVPTGWSSAAPLTGCPAGSSFQSPAALSLPVYVQPGVSVGVLISASPGAFLLNKLALSLGARQCGCQSSPVQGPRTAGNGVRGGQRPPVWDLEGDFDGKQRSDYLEGQQWAQSRPLWHQAVAALKGERAQRPGPAWSLSTPPQN